LPFACLGVKTLERTKVIVLPVFTEVVVITRGEPGVVTEFVVCELLEELAAIIWLAN
jgi:hypothetical protein